MIEGNAGKYNSECNDPKPNYFLESLTTTNLLSF
jgi:hypothetical protein